MIDANDYAVSVARSPGYTMELYIFMDDIYCVREETLTISEQKYFRKTDPRINQIRALQIKKIQIVEYHLNVLTPSDSPFSRGPIFDPKILIRAPCPQRL